MIYFIVFKEREDMDSENNGTDLKESPVYSHYSVNPFYAKNSTDKNENPTGGHYSAVGVSIQWQNGPRKQEDGSLAAPNGAFVEDAIYAAIQRLQFFQDSKFRDRGNALAITKLEEALQALTHRRYEREARSVHGTNEV